ncbi:hypothetical protein FRX31_021906 [Thalictrum thalictroides]|uniref:Uncharacterized protein n=1 Tax=Thalictrum thalictroides TaxID=46969 RepID=A0A7J6VVB3_THATH|nr:hypothetical protein FRX31_021906 [Thalictrum thalictroides]
MAKSRRPRDDLFPTQASQDSPDDVASNEPERPEGLKKSKEIKSKSSEYVQVIQDYFQKFEGRFDLKDSSNNDQLELRHQELETFREKTEALKEKNRIRLFETESKIIATDLDGLIGVAREVMRRNQEEITAKWARELGEVLVECNFGL